MEEHTRLSILELLCCPCYTSCTRSLPSGEAGGSSWWNLKPIFEPWICWEETEVVLDRGLWGPPLNPVKSVDTITHVWAEVHRLAAWEVSAVIISCCCIQTTKPLLAVSAVGWGTHFQTPWSAAGGTSNISASDSPGAAKLEIEVRPKLGQEGNILWQKREATFWVQNWRLNPFINPKVQIRRKEGKRGRHEEFRESRAKIALLNTSFLFWTFSQWLLNLPGFIEKKITSFTTTLGTVS